MEISTVVAIALCAIAVIGFTVFALQRSKLLKIETEHGLTSDTADIVDKAINAGASLADKIADTIGKVADKATDAIDSTVAPIAGGAGSILESVADRIKIRQFEFNALKAESISLAQEVERLRNRQIDMTKVTAQLKLGLMAISQQYSSWEQTTIESEAESAFTQESRTEFISLRRANYVTHIGIDIEQLRFQVTKNSRIQVEGLRNLEILGLKDIKVASVIEEVRKFTSDGSIRSKKAEILENDSRLTELSNKHYSRVLEEIQNKQSIEHLKAANAKFALAFLQACLSPGGFTVEESETLLNSPLRFGELCHEINQQLSERINAHTANQLKIDERSRTLDGEILEIICHELKEPAQIAYRT